MKVSIIVPVYRVEPYLEECLESILTQTYSDYELILVDDGSPDGSGEICDQYANLDPRVRVCHKPNGGASSARNKGLELAKGDCFLFVDGDDIVHPSMLEWLVRAMNEENAEISLTGVCTFENSNPVCAEEYLIRRTEVGRTFCLEPYQIEYVGPVAKLFRRELFSDIRFPEYLKMCEDEAVLYKVLYKCKTVVELEPKLYYYRKTPGSTMNAPFSRKNYDIIPALQERLAYYKHAGDTELVSITEKELHLLRSKLSLKARSAGIYDQVSKEDRIGKLAALRAIHEDGNQELFHWYLSITFPVVTKWLDYYVALKSKLKRDPK